MHDFIGTPIVPGCWVATGGKGNTSAEYGMVLHLVREVSGGKIRTFRIQVRYHDGEPQATVVKRSFQKSTKVVVVNPSFEVKGLFGRVDAGTATESDHKLAGKWLHGQTEDLFT